MTGTLVEPKIVVSSAHGFNHILDQYKAEGRVDELLQPWKNYVQEFNDLNNYNGDEYLEKYRSFCDKGAPQIKLRINNFYVGFNEQAKLTAEGLNPVASVTINPRYVEAYFEGQNWDNLDFAFLTLESAPQGITPVPLLDVSRLDKEQKPSVGSFIGFGGGKKRAAFVPDLDGKYGFSDGTHPILSQMFKPLSSDECKLSLRHGENMDTRGDDNNLQNTSVRNIRWKEAKIPYGVGQPGDSGGPLLINTSAGRRIAGLVKGGGALRILLDGTTAVDGNPASNFDEMYGNYYTGFASLVLINSVSVLQRIEVTESLQSAKKSN